MSETKNPDARPRSRATRRVAAVAAVLVVLLVTAVALVPTILSTDGFRKALVADASAVLGGSIELDALRVGWSGPQRLEGLTLWPGEPGHGEPLLSLPAADVDLAVLPLLFRRIEVRGEITGFRARLVAHADGTTNLQEFLGATGDVPEADGGGGDAGRGPGADLPTSLPVVADLRLHDGEALLVDEASGLVSGIEGVTITVTSPTAAAPIAIEVVGALRLGDARAPVELRASGMGADGAWSASARARGLEPGALTTPILAAAVPLLAGGAGPPTIRAPLDLDVDLAGTSLPALLAGGLADVTGDVTVALGEGEVCGGMLGNVNQALAALRSGRPGSGGSGSGSDPLGGLLGQVLGDKLGRAGKDGKLAETLAALEGLQLDLSGFRGTLRLADGRAEIVEASLPDAAGGRRALPVEGSMQLGASLAQSTLDYRMPWEALLADGELRRLVAGAHLRLTGTLAAPAFDLGLEDALRAALQTELQDRIDERLGDELDLQEKLKEKLGDKLDLGDRLRKKLGGGGGR